MVLICNLSTGAVWAGESEILGHLWLYREAKVCLGYVRTHRKTEKKKKQKQSRNKANKMRETETEKESGGGRVITMTTQGTSKNSVLARLSEWARTPGCFKSPR